MTTHYNGNFNSQLLAQFSMSGNDRWRSEPPGKYIFL